MLILVLAANTSFADFPRLASFHAGDNFMPRQLTKRGHRLVFSNGIIFLAVASIVVLIVTDAKVDRLIPLYAIGVFTSFTLSQAGMAKHHLTHKEPRLADRASFINGIGAVLSLVVDVIIAVTKFTHGAWVIIVLVPVMVVVLVRLNRQYESEEAELEHDAAAAGRGADPAPPRRDRARRPPRRRRRPCHPVRPHAHARRAAGRALRPRPDRDRATSPRPGAGSGCPASRSTSSSAPTGASTRAAAEVVAQELADGETEVSVLLPRREYTPLLAPPPARPHRRPARRRRSPSCRTATSPIVPYHLGAASLAEEPVVAAVAAEPGATAAPRRRRAAPGRRRL